MEKMILDRIELHRGCSVAACSKNCTSWCLAKDVKEHGEAGNVGCASCAEPRFGLNAMETSKDGGLRPKGSWAQKLNSGGVTPETNCLKNSSLQFFLTPLFVLQVTIGFVSIIVL